MSAKQIFGFLLFTLIVSCSNSSKSIKIMEVQSGMPIPSNTSLKYLPACSLDTIIRADNRPDIISMNYFLQKGISEAKVLYFSPNDITNSSSDSTYANIILFRKSRFSLMESSSFSLSETKDSALTPSMAKWSQIKDHVNRQVFYVFEVQFKQQIDSIYNEELIYLMQKTKALVGQNPIILFANYAPVNEKLTAQFLQTNWKHHYSFWRIESPPQTDALHITNMYINGLFRTIAFHQFKNSRYLKNRICNNQVNLVDIQFNFKMHKKPAPFEDLRSFLSN